MTRSRDEAAPALHDDPVPREIAARLEADTRFLERIRQAGDLPQEPAALP